MKIIGNIVPFTKLIKALKWFNVNKKGILAAREAGDKEEEKRLILKSTDTWGKNVCKSIGIDIEVEGKENIPTEGPVVYMANHQGYADIPVLCAVLDKIQFGFVAKQELKKVPLYGEKILQIRSVLINRGDARESVRSIVEGVNLIKEGFSLCIFPEGTRSKCSDMGEFHKGSFKLATKPKVPIVPVSLDGTYRVFEDHGKVMPAKIKVIVHPAIETAGLDREAQNNLPKQVEDIVRQGVERIR